MTGSNPSKFLHRATLGVSEEVSDVMHTQIQLKVLRY
jgi:hypothetical protein